MDERRVIEVLEHGPGIRELVVERRGLAFTPGDCVALFADDGETSRPYSIASGTQEDVLRFLVRRVDGGEVSPHLCSRTQGDPLRMSPPFGWFRPGAAPRGTPYVFLATGTGIAPFLSCLRSHPHAAPEVCLYGVRYRVDAVDVGWLESRCDLRLAVSREDGAGCHRGRVTGLLDQVPLGPEHHYYLCGLDTMIDEVTGWLEGKGISITRIHRECFFNASFEHTPDAQVLTAAGEDHA